MKKHQLKTPDDYKVDMNAVIAKLEAKLEGSEYLAGDEYTLADCITAVFIQWAIWNNKLVEGTHKFSDKMNTWFIKVSSI